MAMNLMTLLKLKQEVEKFKRGEPSLVKIEKVIRYPGYATYVLSLADNFFKEMGLADFLPSDIPMIENSEVK